MKSNTKQWTSLCHEVLPLSLFLSDEKEGRKLFLEKRKMRILNLGSIPWSPNVILTFLLFFILSFFCFLLINKRKRKRGREKRWGWSLVKRNSFWDPRFWSGTEVLSLPSSSYFLPLLLSRLSSWKKKHKRNSGILEARARGEKENKKGALCRREKEKKTQTRKSPSFFFFSFPFFLFVFSFFFFLPSILFVDQK